MCYILFEELHSPQNMFLFVRKNKFPTITPPKQMQTLFILLVIDASTLRGVHKDNVWGRSAHPSFK